MDPPRRVTIDYSLKNIPIPPNTSYLKRLIEKIESVLGRMRWRAFHYLRRGENDCTDEQVDDDHYGLNCRKSPPHIKELEAFEDDVGRIIENITFKESQDTFQATLKEDVARIRRSNAIFVPADKTRNVYEVGLDQYDKLLRENITKHYRTVDGGAYDNVNAEAQIVASRLGVDDRMDVMAKKEAYITLKDHKENFVNNLPCRLINPAKNEMGIVSKHILDDINMKLRSKLSGVTLWRNSTAVIQWFESISDKQDCTFVSFDIVEYYPSITEGLLKRALDFARQHIDIHEDDINVILHSRKSLLFSDDRVWAKKDDNGLFDVTMGSHDGAEICELVGIFALAQLPARYRTGNTGLYRDDGLAVFQGISGRGADRVRKDLTRHFKDLGLRITIDANLKIVNFLDVTFNLNTGKYYPYRKPNNDPLYIHRSSNHPPSILRNLPVSISRRLTEISSDVDAFNDAAPAYNSALKASGYAEQLVYNPSATTMPKRTRNRSRRITWFNPPYNKNVKMNVGRAFLKLLDLHFPRGSKLHKIFNRNTVKVSCSCMENVGTIIKRHNTRVRSKAQHFQEPSGRKCNCRRPAECPLQGECQASGIVYRATVTTDGRGPPKHYIGSTDTTFKKRYANHKASLNHPSKANQTALSSYIWQLKRTSVNYHITWEILQHAVAYTNKTKSCNLCTSEKLLIATADKSSLLNKRSELLSKCRHRSRFLLSNLVCSPT